MAPGPSSAGPVARPGRAGGQVLGLTPDPDPQPQQLPLSSCRPLHPARAQMAPE